MEGEITAIEYSPDGRFLAAGDNCGKITVLKVDNDKKNEEKWVPYFLYQSHEPELDYLKSVGIDAKINKLKFCNTGGGTNIILSTNDKTIKMWKICPKQSYSCDARKRIERQETDTTEDTAGFSDETTSVKTAVSGTEVESDDEVEDVTPSPSGSLHASLKRSFSNAHAYHIDSLDVNMDGETFLTADDLRINWWNMEVPDTAFTVVDIKPDNMEDLTEVITSAQFNPTDASYLIFSSSRGSIKGVDCRANALANKYSQVFKDAKPAPLHAKPFISDILQSVSSAT
ncbi:WD40-repeat-containing domain protein [Ochromonadaceae sp. CCMP2298]|nr:WD40-repeat-containing domain protein [Ochromonadaceae sp. CCMP2298]